MSDYGIVYVTAPNRDYFDKLCEIIEGKGSIYGPAMQIPQGIEYGLEVHEPALGGVLGHLREAGFTIGGGARP